MSDPGSKRSSGAWSELMPEILQQIFLRLVFPDTRRFLAVCRSWRSLARSLASRADLSPVPWLVVFEPAASAALKGARRVGGRTRRFLNPVERRYYDIEAEDFCKSVCHATTAGWLLLSACEGIGGDGWRDLFFLNPFTKARVDLWKFQLPVDLVVCSGPPTGNCFVLLVRNRGDRHEGIILKALREGNNSVSYQSFSFENYNNTRIVDAVFSNGLFYLCNSGQRGQWHQWASISSLDPSTGALRRIARLSNIQLGCWSSFHLVSSPPHVLLVVRGDYAAPCRVFRLNVAESEFLKAVEEVAERVLLVGQGVSMSVPAAEGMPGGTVYFAKFGTFEGGVCKIRSGTHRGPLLLMDGELYECPEEGKTVRSLVSLSDGGFFDDGVEWGGFFSVPPVSVFADSADEWWAVGGLHSMWVEAPLY
ncbi:F-box protein At1g49360-like [Aristolochia californica]|uniref:F-box protein At1g49360-like n=1 Tax=Aristolochia californica TaxID=171875 RepID=UPI0035DDD320